MAGYSSFYPWTRGIFYLLILFFLCVSYLGQDVTAREVTSGPGILLADPEDHIIYEKNADLSFIPASTLKVFTALTALDLLGPDFQFETNFFLGHDLTLKIKGWGDPLLTSREIQAMATSLGNILKSQKTFKIQGLMVDTTAFKQDIRIPGTTTTLNPYDASVGPLCANFNSISFTFLSSATKNMDERKKKKQKASLNLTQPKGQWLSAEPETPLTDFARDILNNRADTLSQGRISLPRGTEALYFGHLLRYFLKKEGIKTGPTVKSGTVTSEDIRIFTWVSPHDLRQVVAKLLYYSNNFMANQLFLTLGMMQKGAPADLTKGIKVAMGNAARRRIAPIFMKEGSGISRQNRISPRAMLKVLQAFKPHHHLMRYAHGIFYKTGTLKGVRTLCGYFKGQRNRLYPFVIMVNQENRGWEDIKKKLQTKMAAWDARL